MPDDDDGIGNPTFEQIRDAMMQPFADRDALWAALKGAHRTGGHVPGRPAPDISLGGPAPHVPPGPGGTPGWTPFPPAVGSAPPDPFTKGSMASAALAEMYEDLLGSGIPLASVERILGAMLAVYGLMTGDET